MIDLQMDEAIANDFNRNNILPNELVQFYRRIESVQLVVATTRKTAIKEICVKLPIANERRKKTNVSIN